MNVMISVVAENQPGTQSRLAVAIRRMGGEIREQELGAAGVPGKSIYNFLVGSAETALDELKRTLTQLPRVDDVSFSAAPPTLSGATPGTADAHPGVTDPLAPYVAALAQAYPDFVRAALSVSAEGTLGSGQMRAVGQRVAREVIARGAVKAVHTTSIPTALGKLVVPAVKPFSLARVQGNTLHFVANPFARHSGPSSACVFLEGFLEGLLRSVEAFPNVTVQETSCSATGAPCCVFTVVG